MLAQCPVRDDFDPFAPGYLANPYPLMSEFRREGPVTYVPHLDMYVVSRYAEVAKILEDHDRFSSANATSPFRPVGPEAAAILASGFPRRPTFTNCDPPRHPRMRNAASRCLTPRRWGKAQPAIRVYAEELVDAVARQPVADLYASLAFPLPAFAGFNLLGFPPEDTEKLKGWCGRRVALTYGDLDAAGQVQAAHDLVDFWAYCRAFVERRQSEPGDDLCTDLLQLSKDRPELLEFDDVVNMIYSISLAGHETSTASLLDGLQSLLPDRKQWDALCANPDLVPGAVEELLRYNSPVHAIRRLTTCEVDFDGVRAPKGATILLVLSSANRDSEHFERADELDVTRENAAEHLTFGRAWHHCLGAPLARYEFNLVLDLLVRRTPAMRLVEGQTIKFPNNMLIRNPERLLVAPGGAA
jgi:cytochrome P450